MQFLFKFLREEECIKKQAEKYAVIVKALGNKTKEIKAKECELYSDVGLGLLFQNKKKY